MLRRLISALPAALLATLLIAAPGHDARAAQSSICIPTTGTLSGLVAMQDANAALAALLSSNSGASPPANDCSALAVKGQIWLDTSTNLLKQFDGTSWLPIALVDGTNHVWTPPVGGGTATLASAGTTDLWSVSQASVSVTGTTTITALASASAVPGTLKVVNFSGALTLTNNATSLILPTAANIVTAAGDYALVLALTNTNVAVVAYNRASGAAVLPAAFGTLTNLASATTTDLGSIASHNVNITGTTTITGFGSSAAVASPVYLLKFAGALTLTYNATSLILPGATNVTTAANDTAEALYLGSGNWQVMSYRRATANVAGKAPTVQVFTSGTGATYTTPTNPSPLYIRVQICAGAGGGGQAGGGSAGSAGGDTSFGTGTTIHGAGGAANGGAGGAGGTGGVDLGTLVNRVAGGTGQYGMGTAAANVNGIGGMGGASVFGGAGAGANATGGVSARANSCSGGGGAGGGSSQNGGAGGGAGEYAEFLIAPPAATYTYTVGAGGGATTGGTGAAGKIIVLEAYN